jgi:AcrR family transcriptional regulator
MSSHDMAIPPAPDATPTSQELRRQVDWNKPRVAAILEAAARCFARSGFETTTAEIAKELGVPKSIIYHYFDNKDALIQEVQRYTYTRHLERLKEILAKASDARGKDALEVLRALWDSDLMRNVSFDVGVWSALRNDSVVREQAAELGRQHRRLIAENVARALQIDGADPARTEPLTTLIVAALTGLSLTAFIEGDDRDANKGHEMLLELIARGVDQFTRRDSEIPPSLETASEPPPARLVDEHASRPRLDA